MEVKSRSAKLSLFFNGVGLIVLARLDTGLNPFQCTRFNDRCDILMCDEIIDAMSE